MFCSWFLYKDIKLCDLILCFCNDKYFTELLQRIYCRRLKVEYTYIDGIKTLVLHSIVI